jgi:hypothetical protein
MLDWRGGIFGGFLRGLCGLLRLPLQFADGVLQLLHHFDEMERCLRRV